LTAQWPFFYTADMEVHFTPEQEVQLSQIAAHYGTVAADLVKDAALRLLEEDGRFRAALRKGIEQANRREFIEEEEMEVRMSGCSSPDAHPLDSGCRRGFGGDPQLPHEAPPGLGAAYAY